MTLILLALAFATGLIPFFVGQRYGILPWVSPLHLVSYYVLFGVVLKTVAMTFQPDVAYFRQFIFEEISVLSGYTFLAGFIIFLSFGYVFGVRRRHQPDLQEFATIGLRRIRHPGKLALTGAIVFLAAAAAILGARGISGVSSLFSLQTLYAVNTQKVIRIEGVEGYGQSFAALKTFFIIPTLAFTVWLGRQINMPSRWGLVMSALLGILVVFMIIFEAKRLELLNLAVYYLCIYVLLRQDLDRKILVKLGLAFGIIVAVFIVMTTLRSTKGGLENVELAFLDSLFEVAGSTYFIDINLPIIIIDRLGQFELFGGASYFYWIFGWVPREFWPEKPAITLGPFVKQEIFGIHGSLGGINPTAAGEAMLNFGWAGVFVGFFLGFAYRRVEEYILRPRSLMYRGGLWVYPLVFYPAIVGTLQSSFSAALIGAVASYILVRLLVTLFSLGVVSYSPAERPRRRVLMD